MKRLGAEPTDRRTLLAAALAAVVAWPASDAARAAAPTVETVQWLDAAGARALVDSLFRQAQGGVTIYGYAYADVGHSLEVLLSLGSVVSVRDGAVAEALRSRLARAAMARPWPLNTTAGTALVFRGEDGGERTLVLSLRNERSVVCAWCEEAAFNVTFRSLRPFFEMTDALR